MSPSSTLPLYYLNLVGVPKRIIYERSDLKIKMRYIIRFSKRKSLVLTNMSSIVMYEGYDDVIGHKDWDETEYLSGDHLHTRVSISH